MRTPSTEERRFFESAVSQYQSDLRGDTSAQGYLMSRGIGPEVAGSFRLGVVRSPLSGHEQYGGRLAIPYLTPSGPVNLRFRCLKQHDCKAENCPKYLSLDGADTNLYNVAALRAESPHICVTEGEIDAITLTMCGIPAVGVPGVENWQEHFRLCLDDFDVVYALGDGDRAGKKFSSFLAKEARARTIRLPKGDDVNGLYVRAGSDAVRGLIG
jgi:DNA primase